MQDTNTQVSKQPSIKERMAELTAELEQGIKELFQSDKYANYLRTMSRFHRYSVSNTLLIHMQKPEANLVAGFETWKRIGRHVKRNERGIKIIAPSPYKKTIEEDLFDPLTKLPMLDENGIPLTETKKITMPAFKPVSVFDVSQTAGRPLPELVMGLDGTVEQYDVMIEALKRSASYPMSFKELKDHMDGCFTGDEIIIRSGMSEAQTILAAVHEMTHARLHSPQQRDDALVAGEAPKDRRTREVEAESVAYAVCAYYGIQTGGNSFGYIASWSQDKDLKELKSSLDIINRTTSGIISDLDHHRQMICRERGLQAPLRPDDVLSNSPGSAFNPLRSSEDMLEQNDNQLDGIINNLPSDSAQHTAEKHMSIARERHETAPRRSVLEQIKGSTPQPALAKAAAPLREPR